MDFARKLLEKYGWEEGQGLGKNKSGISKPVKPKLKFDTVGLGHNKFEDIDNTWWQRIYDEAANNIVTKKNDDDSVVLGTVEDSIEITIKKKKSKKHKKNSKYDKFVKTAELKFNVETNLLEEVDEEPEVKKKKKITSGICDLTDEELFKICGGRTAHKGARHGLKMNAKLARIEQQEKSVELGNETVSEVSHKKSHKKKRKKSKE